MGIDKNVGEGRKRWILSIRTTAEGRERLLKAAEDSGRSLSDEIETRLQASLQRDDIYGGFANAGFVTLLGALLRDAEAQTGKRWRTDRATWQLARDRILQALDERAPKPKSRSTGTNAKKG